MATTLPSIAAIAPSLVSALVGGTIGIAGARFNALRSEKKMKSDRKVARSISVKMKIGIIANSVNACLVERDIAKILNALPEDIDSMGMVHVLDRTPIKFDIDDLEIFMERKMLKTISALMIISSSYTTLLYLLDKFEYSYRELQKAGYREEWISAQKDHIAMQNLTEKTPLAQIVIEQQFMIITWVERMNQIMKQHKQSIILDVHEITPALADLPSIEEYNDNQNQALNRAIPSLET